MGEPCLRGERGTTGPVRGCPSYPRAAGVHAVRSAQLAQRACAQFARTDRCVTHVLSALLCAAPFCVTGNNNSISGSFRHCPPGHHVVGRGGRGDGGPGRGGQRSPHSPGPPLLRRLSWCWCWLVWHGLVAAGGDQRSSSCVPHVLGPNAAAALVMSVVPVRGPLQLPALHACTGGGTQRHKRT